MAGCLALSLLAACGGGGGYGSTADRDNAAAAAAANLIAANNATNNAANNATNAAGGTVNLPLASSLAAQCAVPRTGTDPGTGAAYADTLGSVATEKAWVRSWINDTYLWYSEVPNLNAAGYATAVDYFAVLKTSATTASGAAKDKFHFTYSTPAWLAETQTGASVGYGIDWSLLASTPPRSIVVVQIVPGSVADVAGLRRGATVLNVDGVDLVNGADVTTLNNGLFPTVGGQTHQFTVQDPGASTTRLVSLVSGTVTSAPVPVVKTLSTASGNVGYLLFNDHNAPAESQLIAAITQLKAANISDLVLDLRYNGGGLLDLAAELAYMVAGPDATTGKTFERLAFNDKNPFGLSAADTVTPFHAQSQGFSTTAGQALPYLGLSRVYVLTSSRTCSASEAVVNGLRGAGIAVSLVGGTTCGKPYGFFPQDNCGVTYFAIQFKGVNQLGFGEYSDGFAPTCNASDDYTHALGDLAEKQLASALAYRSTGVCSAASSVNSSPAARRGQSGSGLELVLPDNPARTNRLMRPR